MKIDWKRKISGHHYCNISYFLGGDAPVLLFADTPDLDSAVQDIVDLKFSNAGQICVSPNRVYVQEQIYDQVLAKFKNLAEKRFQAEIQPVVSAEALQRMLRLIQDAQDQGAQLVTGGKAMSKPGFYLQPTVLADVNDNMKCQQEEIFGPILALRR